MIILYIRLINSSKGDNNIRFCRKPKRRTTYPLLDLSMIVDIHLLLYIIFYFFRHNIIIVIILYSFSTSRDDSKNNVTLTRRLRGKQQ